MCHNIIIIAYQFCRAEEIRGPIIDSALEEGRRSGVLSSFAGNSKGGRVGEKEGVLEKKVDVTNLARIRTF